MPQKFRWPAWSVILMCVMLLSSVRAAALESLIIKARVLNVEPVYSTEKYYNQQSICRDSLPESDQQRNGAAGVVLGGMLGAALATQFFDAEGDNSAGMVVGSVIGAIAGNQAAKYHQRSQRQEGRCFPETKPEIRQKLQGYNVTYFYNGDEFRTRMQYHPGRYVRLKVQVSVLD